MERFSTPDSGAMTATLAGCLQLTESQVSPPSRLPPRGSPPSCKCSHPAQSSPFTVQLAAHEP